MDKIGVKQFISINDKKLSYTDSGHGKVIVLLHGYLESVEVWGDFSNKLSQNYRVVCFDIPGHGQSDYLCEKQSMEQLAKCIYTALNKLNISTCFLIGHSMGGYLTLMIHKLFPEILTGFCLFHSHPFSDSEEKQKNRLREMEMILEGKKNLIASVNIPNTFASDNVKIYNDEIEKIKSIVKQTPDQGIIANLHAMMTRPDLTDSLAKAVIPFLYIVGKKDNLIDFTTTVPKIKIPENSELIVIENSGHMGFIEEKEKSLNYIKHFIKSKI